MNNLKNLTKFLVLLTLLAAASGNTKELTAIVDRNEIGIEETLRLTLRYTGNRQIGQPDFTQLKSQFDILSTSKNNKFSNINGVTTSYTDWIMLLAPKREGKLLIPSFSYDGLISDAVEINVTAAQEAPQGTLKDVFIETVIDKDSVYVQEQLLVTYRLYYAVNVDSLDPEALTIENVVKQTLPDVRYTRTINGRLYGIAEFSYALFPQTSGQMTIPTLTWDVKLPNASDRTRSFFGFTGRYEISRLRTDEKTVEVRPRPASFPADKTWLPASSIRIEESWSEDTNILNAGEPVTRTITLEAEGLMASQLTQIWSAMNSDSVKIYADQPKLEDETGAKGLSSTRVESAAVVVAANGQIDLPEIRIPWWDVESDSLQYAVLPQRTLAVSPDDTQIRPRIATSQVESNLVPDQLQTRPNAYDTHLKTQLRIWQSISAAMLVIFVSTITYLWRQGSQPKSPVRSDIDDNKTLKQAYSALRHACESNDPKTLRHALLQWARHYWNAPSISTLSDIARRIGSPELTKELEAIDYSLYAENTSRLANGRDIRRHIDAFTESRKSSNQRNALQGFYSNTHA